MEKWKRTILFWSLAVLFLVTAPIVVLNARGYRFDTSRGVFVYSGTITFKANPQTVDVSLNDETTESKKLNRINNSYNIPGLLPRDYKIKVSAEGYQSWSKSADIHSGLATEFWNILLVRNEYEKSDNQTPGIGKFFLSSNVDLMAYSVQAEEKMTINIFDTEAQEISSSFDFSDWRLISENKKENVEWSPEGNSISVPVERPRTFSAFGSAENAAAEKQAEVEYGYFVANLDSGTSFNLGQFLGEKNISNVRWDPKEKGYLLFLSAGNLYRANTKIFQKPTLIASGVSAFDLSGDQAYYVTSDNNLVFRTASNGTSESVQITNSFPGPEEVSVSRMTVYDDLRIALILENKDLYIFNKGEHKNYFHKLEGGIQEAHFSDDGKKMLFWGDFEISVYYLRDELSQPVQDENTRQNITRYSEPLRNVQWFNDYEHIIFSTDRWTKIIELDPRDKRNCMDLVSTQIESPFVVYSSRLEKLFFTDIQGDSTSLFSIEFPEPTPLLGFAGL